MAGRTHIGLVRKTNEDEFYCDGRNRYFIIADGIGGHQYGKAASQIAVAAMRLFIEANIHEDPEKMLMDAFADANEQVYRYQIEKTGGQLMGGTTLTACFVKNDVLYFGHIGDSRGYVLKPDSLPVQFTEDHTYLAEIAKKDPLTYLKLIQNKDTVKNNTLIKAIGPEKYCDPQFGTMPIENGDMVLLMTDGLYPHVTEQEMLEIATYTADLEEVSMRFEQLALERGGKDNITVIVYKKEEGDSICAKF